MKKILTLITFLMSCSALASATYFERLASMHARGSRLTFKEFKGFYSGRCFNSYQPDRPIGAMLGYMQSSADATEVGPGLSRPIEYKVSAIVEGGSTPGRFDNNFPANKQVYDRIIKRMLVNVSSYVESPTLSFTTDWEPDGRPDIGDELVTYQNYIIEKATALIAQNYQQHGFKKPGEVLYMCYYFKKLD